MFQNMCIFMISDPLAPHQVCFIMNMLNALSPNSHGQCWENEVAGSL